MLGPGALSAIVFVVVLLGRAVARPPAVVPLDTARRRRRAVSFVATAARPAPVGRSVRPAGPLAAPGTVSRPLLRLATVARQGRRTPRLVVGFVLTRLPSGCVLHLGIHRVALTATVPFSLGLEPSGLVFPVQGALAGPLPRRHCRTVQAASEATGRFLVSQPPARGLWEQGKLPVDVALVQALRVGCPYGAQPKRRRQGSGALRERAAGPPHLSHTAAAT